jgi:preprotein translocase subunit Sss1
VDEPEYQNILSQSKVPHAIYHISWLKEGSSVGTVYFDEEEYSKSWKLSSVLFLAIIGSVAFVTVIILLVSFL